MLVIYAPYLRTEILEMFRVFLLKRLISFLKDTVLDCNHTSLLKKKNPPQICLLVFPIISRGQEYMFILVSIILFWDGLILIS